jgi:hypothetical protein
MRFKEMLPADCQIRRRWSGFGNPDRAKYEFLEIHIEPKIILVRCSYTWLFTGLPESKPDLTDLSLSQLE